VRKTRKPPGWLAELLLAMHDTCTEAGCHTAARVCDVDHATPWAAGGHTDAGNLGPLCATGNRSAGRHGWRIDQHPDGSRHWRHPRSGLRIRTVPATWKPPNLHTFATPPRPTGSLPERQLLFLVRRHLAADDDPDSISDVESSRYRDPDTGLPF
jgi:hypothetical protein